MKISIVGRGTSSIITAMIFLSEGFEVDVFYDDEKDYLNVGESTTPHISSLIKRTFGIGIGELLSLGIVSLKSGIEFINWGKGKNFIHGFIDNITDNNLITIHFESSKFNNFFKEKLEEKGVNYFNQKVEDYHIDDSGNVVVNNRKYDFLVFCSGWCEDDEYQSPIFETVNSAVLYTKNYISNPYCTLHEATEDGWQFGLPFPNKNITKHGYLFNRNITSKENVIKKLNISDYHYIEWKPKYSKKFFQNKSVAYNGNKLLFLEPLQALSLYYYYQSAYAIVNYLLRGKTDEAVDIINREYNELLYEYQLSLAFHYRYGSIYNTKYWEDIVKRSNEFMNSRQKNFNEYIIKKFSFDHNTRRETFSIGCFRYQDYRQIHCGMTGDDIEEVFRKIKS